MPPTFARTIAAAPRVTATLASSGSPAHAPNPTIETAQVRPATIHPHADGAPARVARLSGAGAIARISRSDDARPSTIAGTSVAAKAASVMGARAATFTANRKTSASVP